MGFTHDGGYGPYELVHENIFFPSGRHLADRGDAAAGHHGHGRPRAGPRVGRPARHRMLLVGARGRSGLASWRWRSCFSGRTSVFITDTIPYRLTLAEKLGGISVPLPANSLPTIDAAVDTSGREAARRSALTHSASAAFSLRRTRRRAYAPVSPDLIATERAVLGSEYFRFDELPANLLAPAGAPRNTFAPVITHRFPVGDIQAAFETFFGGQTGNGSSNSRPPASVGHPACTSYADAFSLKPPVVAPLAEQEEQTAPAGGGAEGKRSATLAGAVRDRAYHPQRQYLPHPGRARPQPAHALWPALQLDRRPLQPGAAYLRLTQEV